MSTTMRREALERLGLIIFMIRPVGGGYMVGDIYGGDHLVMVEEVRDRFRGGLSVEPVLQAIIRERLQAIDDEASGAEENERILCAGSLG